MKKFKWFLLLAAFVTPLFFVSCSDDDDDIVNGNADSNHFTYDGNIYDLAEGFLISHPQFGEGYTIEIILGSEGFYLYEDDWFTGQGHGIFFDLFSPTEYNLAPGVYEYSEEDSGDLFTFHFAGLGVDLNIEEETGIYMGIVGGTVVVAKSGSNYILTIEVIAGDDKPVTGYYNGPLTRPDDDD